MGHDESMLGDHEEWSRWYEGAKDQLPFGDTQTYQIAAQFLDGQDVEDWGSGYGWYKQFHNGGYVGIDGVHTGWEDKVENLCNYRSDTQAIFMRGVLEHNRDWREILNNCAASAKERLCIVVVTPNGNGEVVGRVGEVAQIPDIALPWKEIDQILSHHGWVGRFAALDSSCHHKVEAVWLATKKPLNVV